MNKNVFLAFFLSALVIIAYYLVFPPQPPPPRNVGENSQTQNQATDSAKGDATLPSKETSTSAKLPDNAQSLDQKVPDIEVKQVEVMSGKYRLEISNKNGALTSLFLDDYLKEIETKEPIYQYLLNLVTGSKKHSPKIEDPTQKVQMVNPAVPETFLPFTYTIAQDKSPIFYDTPLINSLNTKNAKSFTLVGESGGVTVEKTIVFYPDTYLLDIAVKLTNSSGEAKSIYPQFMVGTGNEAIPSETQPNFKQGIIYFDKNLDSYTADEILENGIKTESFDWGGVMGKYFISVVKKPGDSWKAILEQVASKEANAPNGVPVFKLESNAAVLQVGESKTDTFKVYFGPKYTVEMDKFDINMVDTLDMNLNFIAQPMLSTLRWLHDFFGNWGVAIIFLTILVRILIFPLAYKGMTGMQKMSKLTPKVQALKKKYGKDKEKFNKEVMDLYKRNKANPMGGCLPLIIQMPIFFALYSALMPAIELRYQPFMLWMYDLSKMDYTFILPILCGGTMYVQQKLTPTPATADPVQTKIMRFFPVMMSIFFAFASSGLVLYWTISGVISILQQLIFKKINDIKEKKEPKQDK